MKRERYNPLSYFECIIVLCILLLHAKSQTAPEVKWSDWSEWSNCTRSCGGGIIEKQRECIELKNGTKAKCIGARAIYKMCNIQDCPDDAVDFRMQQCSKYDKIPHKGKLYRWAGFHHSAGECELKCMPKGEFFYVTFTKKVIDGTRCNPYSNDVCINGNCVKVGCDKQLYSTAITDVCGVCNGNGDSCKLVQREQKIKANAYGYIEIATIPAGATNIKIKEIGKVASFIAVDRSGKYILNGERLFTEKVKTLLDGGAMLYEKTDSSNELNIAGPIRLPIDIHIFVFTGNGPNGNKITYEYYIPNSYRSNVDNKPRYSWISGSWSSCSKECATGEKVRNISCINLETSFKVKNFNCDETRKPRERENCAEVECPPEWYISQWSPCSRTCGEGTRTRRVNCIALSKDGETNMLDYSRCRGSAVHRVEKCMVQNECPEWNTGDWSKCSRTCGTGVKRRDVTCAYAITSNSVEEEKCSLETKPSGAEECFNAPCGAVWVAGSWTKCSTHCGVGVRSRLVACKTSEGIEVPTRHCDKDDEPKHFENCQAQGPCRPVWYASQWSSCSGKCGYGMQMRNVYCVEISQNQMYMVSESTCIFGDKPKALRRCEDQEPCFVNYFASEWNKCSATCGSGVKVREVRCYADRRIDHTGKSCAKLRKPSSHEICEIKPCDSGSSTTQTDSDIVKLPTTTTTTTTTTTEQQTSQANVVMFSGPEKLRYTEDADYSCFVTGNPKPQVQFLLNGRPLSGTRFRVTRDEKGARLTILTAFAVDSGKLTCSAENTLGTSTKSLQLEVIEPPRARIVPGNVVREEGDGYVIVCEVKGKANPRVQWTKDGISFEGDRRRASVQETRIYFRSLIPADTGRYRCTAFNSAGSGTGEMKLTVNKKPEVTSVSETCYDNNSEADCRQIRTLRFLCNYATYRTACCATCST